MSGLLVDHLLLLALDTTEIHIEKWQRQTQFILCIDESALNTAMGRRMEKGDDGIIIHVNPAQQGSPAVKLGGIILFLKSRIKWSSKGFRTPLH